MTPEMIEQSKANAKKMGLENLEVKLGEIENVPLEDNIADVVCAIDMFCMIQKPTVFLTEAKRIIKKDGTLVIDDGHQPRSITKQKILDSGIWDIAEETKDHLKCKTHVPYK